MTSASSKPEKTSSATVSKFLAALPEERRADVDRVRNIIRRHLPKGYDEVVGRNMLEIVGAIPLDRWVEIAKASKRR